MRRVTTAVVLFVVLSLLACKSSPTPTPVPVATAVPTAQPTSTPTATLSPTSTPAPSQPAPEQAFVDVGSIARFNGEGGGVSGRAVVAGLQTIVIREFEYDGQCPKADIRLGKEGGFDQPTAVLVELEPRSYEKEMFVLTVPAEVTADNTNAIAVYCVDTGEVVDWGSFRYQEGNSSS